MLKIIGTAYIAVIIGLFIEAYFYTELDSESKRFLKERENKLNKEKNEHKSTS